MAIEAKRTRNANGRNYYQAPCCEVNIGILDDVSNASCPACGAMLIQNGDILILKARVRTVLSFPGDPDLELT